MAYPVHKCRAPSRDLQSAWEEADLSWAAGGGKVFISKAQPIWVKKSRRTGRRSAFQSTVLDATYGTWHHFSQECTYFARCGHVAEETDLHWWCNVLQFPKSEQARMNTRHIPRIPEDDAYVCIFKSDCCKIARCRG